MEMEHPDFYGIRSLSFEKTGEKFQTEVEEDVEEYGGMTEKKVRRIVMDDIRITVQKKESEEKADVEESAGNIS